MEVHDSIIIIIIILIIWYVLFTYIHPKLELIDLKKGLYEKKFKTGDIILFKAVDNNLSPFIASYYGHIGIVWVDPLDPKKTPYIFEATNPKFLILDKNHSKKGIYKSKLENRIKKYKGYCFYKELKNEIDMKICIEFKKFIDYALKNMEYDMDIITNLLKKGIFGEKIHNRVNCGEMAFLCLLKLKLLPMKYYKKRIIHHLKWMCSIKHLDNNSYREIKKISFHPF